MSSSKQVSHYYRNKLVTYVNCSYWLNPGIAPYLTKGSIVEVYGRVGATVWVNKEGEAKANLTMHVQNIKNFGSRAVQALLIPIFEL